MRQHGPDFLLGNLLENKSKMQLAASETFCSGLSQVGYKFGDTPNAIQPSSTVKNNEEL